MIAACERRVAVEGIGSYAPARVMTNDELATMVETSDEWIRERTGIRERRIASPEEMGEVVALLADFRLSAMVGQVVQANGGSTRSRA